MIKPTDNLLIVAMTEDEFSHLEVQIFSEDKSLFVHHDIALPDFPLSLAWMDIPPFTTSDGTQSTVGNYIAVGTFGPAIEIWNLDVLDPLEPTAILGGENSEFAAPVFNKKGKKIKSKSSAFLPGSHEAAVMGLSWNSTYRQALASGSADKTVKIWDVTTQECSHTFTHHTDKVQSVNWHPTEPWLLATGSFDRTMGLIDARSASTSIACSLTSDIESLSWDPFNPYHMYCATEDGTVCCVDIRNTPAGGAEKGKKGKKPIIFTFQAHSATTSAVSFSSRIPGMLATASVDKTVKVWDVNDLAEREYSDNLAPKMVAYKTMNVGKLFALQFSPDEPFLLASAGDQGMVAIWESDELGAIEDYFSGRVTPPKSTYSTLEAGAGE
ncbi:WD40-repeat-containing domain protein, partial [Ochromonadaceae sp. CCMP2298]